VKVLVTGGAGLIGLAARRLLPAADHEIVATDLKGAGGDDPELLRADLRDAAAMEKIIVEHGIEAIMHGGGISGPVAAKNDPLRVFDINVAATAHLLDLARRHGLKRFLLLSSHVVYGDVGPGRIDEEFPFHPATSYAASKVAGEALVESYAREWGLSGVSLRVTRVYGPYRRDNCFLRRIILDEAAGRQTLIRCDPAFAYHYVHVDDLVGAIAAALAVDRPAHYAYNVTSGQVVTMPRLVEIAREVLPRANIGLLEGVDDAPEVQTDFDLSRIAADLNWRPSLTLEQGFPAYLASTRSIGLAAAT
jgi:UDP-glucuronate 4-epimerase